MSVLNIPNVFVTGTTINSAPFNANFNAVAASVNSIDNSNIGAAGIFANQLIPTSAAQATFGGLIGYTFLAPSASTTPLTVSGVAGQSVDIFDVTLTSGGNKTFAIGPSGIVTAFNQFYATALTSISAAPAAGAGDVIAQRTSSTGRFTAGGASAGTADYGILNVNAWTFQNSSTFAPIFAGAYTNSSDATLKKNVAPITQALQTLAQLKPSSYQWIADGQPDLGFLAQDMQTVLPQIVRTSKDGSMGIVYTGVTALNTAAIIELAVAFKAYVSAHP